MFRLVSKERKYSVLKMSSSETLVESNAPPTLTNGEATLSEPVPITRSHELLLDFKVTIPRISSRELHPQRPHSAVTELEQREYLLNGPGSKRDSNKLTVKVKNPEIEEAIKRAKKYAMEQSVRFVLVKQQQQQQKQQLDLIKKQQALLLMCR